MNEDLVNKLADAAWHVLNFDNDPGTEPEGPANWKALTKALRDVLRKHGKNRVGHARKTD